MGGRTLVIGGGGREHALTIGLLESPLVEEVHVAPGNAGTAQIGTNHTLSSSDVEGLVNLAIELEVDLVVVGPEGPLVDGIADRLTREGIPCFGPHAAGARLEGSKEYAKNVMLDLGVPTGAVRRLESMEAAREAIDESGPIWVIKRDVLAGGKGVTVTSERSDALKAIAEGLELDGFVLLEEFLVGEEASMLVIMDESGFVCLPASQDHKRVGEGDAGPNTGGMGAYAPAPVVTAEVEQRVITEIVEPMHRWLISGEDPYRGCLYVGLMIDEQGAPSVVEFNVRFGDPETQVTIPLISSDLFELLQAAASGRLRDVSAQFHDRHALSVVLASAGYPGPVRTDLPITGTLHPEESAGDWIVHHAATSMGADGSLRSSGGRVLAVTGISDTLEKAARIAYQRLDEIHLEGAHFRRDIGYRAL